MRELERKHSADTPSRCRLAIVGRGRLGRALAQSLTADPSAGPDVIEVLGPFGRGADGANAEAVLLCVPDGEIEAAARLIAPGRLVGHCSGGTSLEVLEPHERFSMHPLMTVTAEGARFAGAGAAVDGSSDHARDFARRLAERLALVPIEIAAGDRALYHAAASIASNFLITIEAAAERLAGEAGVSREQLVPLVRATVENWARIGAERALTGPVVRGDTRTVVGQRLAIEERAPDLLGLFNALVVATEDLSRRSVGAIAGGAR
jgi:predicted short-subunit dehydrogenase-like oxidoreductase (DUF2520 family)